MSEKCSYCDKAMEDEWYRLDTSNFLQPYDFCSPQCLYDAIKTKWIDKLRED